jgi:hypothetical protein
MIIIGSTALNWPRPSSKAYVLFESSLSLTELLNMAVTTAPILCNDHNYGCSLLWNKEINFMKS